MKAEFVLAVFTALVEHVVEHDESPTVRELCMAIGYNGEKEIWWALQLLESIGLIKWSIDSTRGRKAARGIELLVKLKQPMTIPIVGYTNAPADFVPGERWVEFHANGRIVVNNGGEKWDGVISLT